MATLHEQILKSRLNGILLPLSAMKTEKDWGVGDFGSLVEWIGLLSRQGTRILQILPLQETAPGINCPYSALTSFAVDPIYVDVSQLKDIQNNEPAQEFIQSIVHKINEWNQAARAPFAEVKKAKLQVLWLAYRQFLSKEVSQQTDRYRQFQAYCQSQAAWLDGYKVFRALKQFYHWQSWTEWPAELQNYHSEGVRTFEKQHHEYVQFYAYIQWVLDLQLQAAKAAAQEKGVFIFGDIPFATNLDSAEVWAERENFRIGWEIGAPADQFSQNGQRWGLPAYDWHYLRTHNFDLWRRKIRRATQLYDIFRLDHLVGFFRTYVFAPGQEKGGFDLEGDQNQIDRGYEFLKMVLEEAGGKLPVGEDLGVIPNYVRRMLVDLRIPGYKVLRWEREDNGYYREPRHYPVASLATTSTHDTETLRGWWETMDNNERRNIWEMISAQKTDGHVPFTLENERAILRRVLDSNAALTLFSWQDVAGSLERINTPGTVGDENWTYRTECTAKEAPVKYAPQLAMYRQLLKETSRA